METWALILMIILVLAVAAMVVLVWLAEKKNVKANQKNILYPFSANIKPGDTVAKLTTSTGSPQIDCSAQGGKINIVGAWAEVQDPYSECAPTAASAVNLTCGIPGAKVPCKADTDCGTGMKCSSGYCTPGRCQLIDDVAGTIDTENCECGGNYCPIQPGTACTPASGDDGCGDDSGMLMRCLDPATGMPAGIGAKGTCQVNPAKACTGVSPVTGKTCAVFPLCSNIDPTNKSGVRNTACSFANTGATLCRPRDGSAYLAGVCDGKETCDGVKMWDSTSPGAGFGPTPCAYAAGSLSYSRLPNIPGQAGDYNQGYYVHGLYTCVVDD